MKLEISVTEAKEMINEIRQQPESFFEMVRADVKPCITLSRKNDRGF